MAGGKGKKKKWFTRVRSHHPWRTKPVAAALALTALIGGGLVTLLLQSKATWKGVPSSPWRDGFRGSIKFWYKLDADEIAWLLFNTACALLLPFLELIGHFNRPLRLSKTLKSLPTQKSLQSRRWSNLSSASTSVPSTFGYSDAFPCSEFDETADANSAQPTAATHSSSSEVQGLRQYLAKSFGSPLRSPARTAPARAIGRMSSLRGSSSSGRGASTFGLTVSDFDRHDFDCRVESQNSSPQMKTRGSGGSGRPKRRATAAVKLWERAVAPRSKTAVLHMAAFMALNLLLFAVHLRKRLLDPAAPSFARFFQKAHPEYTPAHSATVAYAVGAAAIWPALNAYSIAILPVSRTSLLLSCIGLSYEETNTFHKFAGALAALWALIHGVFCTFPVMTISWEWYLRQAWSAEYGPREEWALPGQLAVIMQVVMIIFSFKYFRHNHYKLFRGTHALYPLIFMAAAAHSIQCAYYFQLGMTLIMADVAARLSVKVHTTTATLTPTRASSSTAVGEKTVVIHATSPFPAGAVESLALPGKFFYMQVPSVSGVEWHPFSVTHADAAGNLTFVVKVFGAWTSGVHALANNSMPGTHHRIKLEGPYGVNWSKVVAERLLAGVATAQHNAKQKLSFATSTSSSKVERQHRVAMIAGGIGISPLSSTIASILTTAPGALSHLQVLWSVRDEAVQDMWMPLLQKAARAGAHITVHNTFASATAVNTPTGRGRSSRSSSSGSNGSGSSSDSSSRLNRSAAKAGFTAVAVNTPVSAVTPSRGPFFFTDSEGCSTPVARTAVVTAADSASPCKQQLLQQGRFEQSQCPKKMLAPWNVRSPLWTWFVGTSLLWLSAIGSSSGFIAARAVCSLEPVQPSAAAIQQYNTAVVTRYTAAHAARTNGTSPAAVWPQGQGRMEDVRLYEQLLLGQRPQLVMACSPTPVPGEPDPQWAYGQPAPCRYLPAAIGCPGVVTPLLSWGLSLLLALCGGTLFARARAAAAVATATVSQKAKHAAMTASAADTDLEESHDFRRVTKDGMPILYGLTADSSSSSGSSSRHGSSSSSTAAAGTVSSVQRRVTEEGGRPCIDTYMRQLAEGLVSTNGSKVGIVDVYVCGSQLLQETTKAAFYRHVHPVSSGSSFFGLVYAIG